MEAPLVGRLLAEHKLAAFERLQPAFEANFHFMQDVQGQRRFTTFPVAQTIRYLHAHWICACKDRLLSVSEQHGRDEGKVCLDLLRQWQEGETAPVVAFLQRKLAGVAFAELTHQIQEGMLAGHKDEGLVRRLVHGRLISLNRSINQLLAVDAIFALPEAELMQEVEVACASYGHAPDQIEQQLAVRQDPLSSYAPHQLLAQRNMMVMNKVGVHVVTRPADLSGAHLWNVLAPTPPGSLFAEQVIRGYAEREPSRQG